MACPGLAVHTLAGLFCAPWLPSGASTPGELQHSAKPQPPQTTCPARPQHPVQAPSHQVHTAGAAFDLAVAHGMPRAGHSHTGRAPLCGMVSKRQPTHLDHSSIQQKRNANRPTAKPGRSTTCRPNHTSCTLQRVNLTLQWPMACPGRFTHTLAGLCLLWLPSDISISR